MSFHGMGLGRMARITDEKPKVTWPLLKRVAAYARPYGWQIAGMLLVILVTTGLSMLSPLVMRDLIDRTIPSRDITRLVWLSLALLFLPIMDGGLSVLQRKLNANVGEGVIYDLRVALYSGLQRMSLRFFTNTKVGELMSRLNNDVVGAQNAISNTFVSIITNLIKAVVVLIVMFSMEWRLTIISVIVMPLFIFAARKMADRLRDIAHQQMEANAQMNAMMNETLNIGGALLVKLFGRKKLEVSRLADRARQVRRPGCETLVYRFHVHCHDRICSARSGLPWSTVWAGISSSSAPSPSVPSLPSVPISEFCTVHCRTYPMRRSSLPRPLSVSSACSR